MEIDFCWKIFATGGSQEKVNEYLLEISSTGKNMFFVEVIGSCTLIISLLIRIKSDGISSKLTIKNCP